jgi:RNA recognition motif-containing protein
MGIRLFVGNLPFNVTEDELREHFSTIGPLSYLSIPIDRETGKPRGIAFIEFKDRAQADEAIRRFNNQSFQGRSITVSEARARDLSRRTAAPPRPSLSRSSPTAGPAPPDPPGHKPSRDFGPDKPSRHGRSRVKGGFNAERGPKGPMREVVRGRFFDQVDDDDYDDYDDNDDDYNDNHEEVNEEGFDAGVSDSEKET